MSVLETEMFDRATALHSQFREFRNVLENCDDRRARTGPPAASPHRAEQSQSYERLQTRCLRHGDVSAEPYSYYRNKSYHDMYDPI